MVEDFEQGRPQEGKRSDDVRVSTTGFIFLEDGVFLPVIADFNTRPVATDVGQPLCRGYVVRVATADEPACESRGFAFAFLVTCDPRDLKQRACSWKVAAHGVRRHAFELEGDAGACCDFLFFEGKKGVAVARASASARNFRRLSRTWNR